MQVVRSAAEIVGLSRDPRPSVVTVGNFDGVHCGHRKIIDAVRTRAHEIGARAVVVTFDPHPAQVLGVHAGSQPGERLKLLTPTPHKLALLAAAGVDLTLLLPFTRELSVWPPERFAREIFHDFLHAVEIHEGETFRFGHNASADIHSLAELGRHLGFSCSAFCPLRMRGAPVSSSRIRALIAEGDVSAARPLLGRPFGIRGTPASGRGYGTLYAVPTVNLAPYPELLPANGVYITTLRVGEGPGSRVFQGVTNSGNRPTFGPDSFAVETHLLNFEPIALNENTALELSFLKRIREERRFASPEDLKKEIGRDVARALRYFQLASRLARTSSGL